MVSKKSKLIFLMPPKTASNSLKECLLDSSIKLEPFPKSFRYPKIHLFLSELVELFEIKDLDKYKIVQICRNPYERFASLYYHNIRLTPKNHELKNLKIQEYADRSLKSLKSDNYLNSFYGKNKFFYKFIQNGESWGGTRTILEQTQWNDLDANIKYFKIEDIKDNMESISDYVGMYLPDLNTINKNKTDVDYDKIITKELKETIKEIHNRDFINLGYEY